MKHANKFSNSQCSVFFCFSNVQSHKALEGGVSCIECILFHDCVSRHCVHGLYGSSGKSESNCQTDSHPGHPARSPTSPSRQHIIFPEPLKSFEKKDKNCSKKEKKQTKRINETIERNTKTQKIPIPKKQSFQISFAPGFWRALEFGADDKSGLFQVFLLLSAVLRA